MAAGLIVLAAILGSVATALAAPFLIALYMDEFQAAQMFGATAAAYAFIASAIFITLRGKERGLKRVETFGLLLLAWALLLAGGALPLALTTQMSGIDAAFETVSAITTSNASVFASVEDLPRSVLFWRVQLQWLGGLLTLLSLVIVLAPAGVGGLPRRQIALLEKVGIGGGGRILKTCMNVGGTYTLFTLICAAAIALSGVPLFDSLCLAAGTISTGGFMPVNRDLASYGAPLMFPIMLAFMIIGATSILWHRMLFSRRGQLLREHRESYLIISSIIVLGVLLTTVFAQIPSPSGQSASAITPFLDGFFLAASLVTTTGFEWSGSQLEYIQPIAIGSIVIVGGGAFSTAGGLKFYRIGGMLLQSLHELNRLVFPHSVQSERFGGSQVEIGTLKAIWSFLIVAVLLVWGCAAVLTLDGIPFEASIIASLAAFSSMGSAYSPEWNDLGQWPEYVNMPVLSKSALGVTMLLGRIEILAFFGVFNLTYWNSR